MGDNAYAIAALQRLAVRIPKAAAVHLELGMAYRGESRTLDAIVCPGRASPLPTLFKLNL